MRELASLELTLSRECVFRVGGGEFVEGFADALLIFREFAGALAQSAQFLGKLLRSALAEFLFHFLEFLLSPGRGVGRIGEFSGLEFFSRFLNVLAGFFELLFFLAHVGAVLIGVHAFREVIDFAKEIALFFLQSFQLALNLGALLFVCILELLFEFLDLLSDGLLTTGEFLEAVEDGEVLLLLGGGLLLLSLGLLFVFEFVLFELKIHVSLFLLRALALARLL